MPFDRSEYPDDWELRSHFVRFVRAGGACEWCEAVHGNPHPITGSTVVLTTAHIYHSKDDNSLLKLAALCQRCHHDRAHHIRNRKYGRNKNQLDLNLYPPGMSFKNWVAWVERPAIKNANALPHLLQ